MNATKPIPYRSALSKLFEEQGPPHGSVRAYDGSIRECMQSGMTGSDAAIAAWLKSGKQSFYLAPRLIEALDDTDLRGAPTSALRAPYGAFWIEAASFPERFGLFPNLPGQTENVLGLVVIHEEPKPPWVNHRQVWVFVLSRVNADYIGTLEHCFYLEEPTVEGCIDAAVDEMWFRDITKRQRPAMAGEALPPVPEGLQLGEANDASKRLMAFVCNFLLYCSTPNPEFRKVYPPQVEKGSGKKHEEFRRSYDSRNGIQWSVGASVTYLRESKGSDGAMGEGGKRRRHLVRGHYRTALVGPLRSQERVVWIHPHWRGSILPGQSERTYVASC